MARHRKKVIDVLSAIIFLALIVLDAAAWKNIFLSITPAVRGFSAPRIYLFPMAHSESALLILPDGRTILTGAGSDDTVADDLQKTLPPVDGRSIDLAILSYTQPNDYDGYQYLLEHYAVGAFLYNGRADDAHKTEWTALMNAIGANHIPLITIGAGDRIHYGNAFEVDVLSPDAAHARSPDPADTGVAQRVIAASSSIVIAPHVASSTQMSSATSKGGSFLLYNK
jgi:beta-lactamase superfamily II metal-dependent hydrolase